MPFKSEKQRRYLWKHEPKIAKEWTKAYGSKPKGKCTPITKPGCTGRAKALAKTFKKMAKKRKG